MHLLPTQEEVVGVCGEHTGARCGREKRLDPKGPALDEILCRFPLALPPLLNIQPFAIGRGLARLFRPPIPRSAPSRQRAFRVTAHDRAACPWLRRVARRCAPNRSTGRSAITPTTRCTFRQFLDPQPGEAVVLVDEHPAHREQAFRVAELLESRGAMVVGLAW